MKKHLIIFLLLTILPWKSWAKEWLDPRYEKRQYRTFVLKNQMKVLLISDPTIHRSAASLSVEVGSLSNPDDRAGLAHFLEHMLLLGSKKYSEVGSFMKFVSSNDGADNAYTSDDHTNYYYQVASDRFEESLDHFSQLFIAPLLNPEYIKREMKAVDSEHSKNLSSDYRRIARVQRLQYEKGHPTHKFRTGNLETLNQMTREELLAFYRSHYSSNLMNLVVLGKQDLDTLQKWVVPRFSKIVNTQLKPNAFPQQILAKSIDFRLLQVKTVKDTRTLRLFFPLPTTKHYYASKPISALSHLIGDEGEGSLLSLLKQENLATELSAGHGITRTKSYSGFGITITLTPEGLKKYQKVITRTFQYLRMLRKEGYHRYLFDDIQKERQLRYRFQEKQEGMQLVSHMAAWLHYYPLNQVATAPHLVSKYEPHLFDSILFRLTPDNMMVTLAAQNVETNAQEKYFKAEYAYSVGKKDLIKKWQAVPEHPKLRLPKQNQFFADDFDILTNSDPFTLTYQSLMGLQQDGLPPLLLQKWQSLKGKSWASWKAFKVDASLSDDLYQTLVFKHVQGVPHLLLNSDQAKIWFQRDFRFLTPKAKLIFLIHTPETHRSPKNMVLTRLYVDAIEEGLNEFEFPLRNAGLGFDLATRSEGVKLTVSGYSDNILGLLIKLSQSLKTISIDQKTFTILKEHRLQAYKNFELRAPYRQAGYYKNIILTDRNYSLADLEKATTTLTLNDLKTFTQTLYQNIFVEGVVHGNLDATEVKNKINEMLSNLAGQPLPESEKYKSQVIQLPHHSNYEYKKVMKTHDSAVSLFIQVDQTSPKIDGMLRIISKALRHPFFTEMRTQQQLGYLVWSYWGKLEQTTSLQFVIQSPQYPPGELLKRIDTYFAGFLKQMQVLTDEKLEKLKKTVIAAMLKKASTLNNQTNRLYNIAFKQNRSFDHTSEDIQAVENITVKDLQAFIQTYLVPEKQKRLVLKMVGKDHQSLHSDGTPITLISSFKTDFPCPEFCAP